MSFRVKYFADEVRGSHQTSLRSRRGPLNSAVRWQETRDRGEVGKLSHNWQANGRHQAISFFLFLTLSISVSSVYSLSLSLCRSRVLWPGRRLYRRINGIEIRWIQSQRLGRSSATPSPCRLRDEVARERAPSPARLSLLTGTDVGQAVSQPESIEYIKHTSGGAASTGA